MKYTNISANDPSIMPLLPVPRGQASLALLGNPPVNIILFGGVTAIDGKRQALNDMWSFSTYTHTWRQIFPNSELPDVRSGASFVVFLNKEILKIDYKSE